MISNDPATGPTRFDIIDNTPEKDKRDAFTKGQWAESMEQLAAA
jgi:hypothetical protein